MSSLFQKIRDDKISAPGFLLGLYPDQSRDMGSRQGIFAWVRLLDRTGIGVLVLRFGFGVVLGSLTFHGFLVVC